MSTLLVAAGVHTLADAVGRGEGRARAVLVDGDRIAWVGSDPSQAPSHDATVDLGGAWVTPAFVDAHVHATATGLSLDAPDLTALDSAEALLSTVRRAGEALAPGEPLIATGWEETRWADPAVPSAAQVAAAAPGRPVHLGRVDGHSCLVDAQTLADLALDDLEGVDRDLRGRPTGWLREAAAEAAWRRVWHRLPRWRLARARAAFTRRAAALGIASVHEMGHPALSSLDDARQWRRGTKDLDITVWWADPDPGVALDAALLPGGDLFVDGSIGSETAAVSRGYPDGGHGQLLLDVDAVAHLFRTATSAGASAGVHAIGDRAIDVAVRGLGAAARTYGTGAVRGCRHRVEHIALPTAKHIGALGALGVVASMQPAFDAAWGGSAGLYATRLGARLAQDANPLGDLDAAGAMLAFGSDAPITPLDPWGAVVAAERHRGGRGVTRLRALRAHTLGGRHAAGQDHVGALIAGHRADLAVWDLDPLTCDDPRALRCLATVVAGRCSHGTLVLGGPA